MVGKAWEKCFRWVGEKTQCHSPCLYKRVTSRVFGKAAGQFTDLPGIQPFSVLRPE